MEESPSNTPPKDSPKKKNPAGSQSAKKQLKDAVSHLENISREDISRSMRPWYEDLLQALRFLTRIPVADDAPADSANLRRAARAFPLTGLVVGGAGALVILFAAPFGIPATVTVMLALATMVMLTGGLHEDGLADSSDALFATTDPDERMKILKDSSSGVFAMLALIFVILIKWTALIAIMEESPLSAASAIVAASIVSRVAFLVPVCFMSPIKEDGLGAALGSLNPASLILPLGVGAGALFFVLFGNIIAIAASLIVAAVAAFVIAILAEKKLGGYNGDIAGATQQISEAVALVSFTITVI